MMDPKNGFFPKVRECELFSHLSVEELDHLFRGSQPLIRNYPKGKILAQRGNPVDHLMILLEGELSADILDMEGQILKVESLKAPTLVAAGILFSDQNYLPVQLSSVTDSQMMKIPREELLKLAGRDHRILNKLLTDSGNRIHFLAEKLRFIRFGTIDKKICAYLLEQYSFQKTDLIILPYSINTLSELFGVSRPSLSRSLGLLTEEGLISREGKKIRLQDQSLIRQRCMDE